MIVLIALDDSIYSDLAFCSVKQRSWNKETKFILCSVIEGYLPLNGQQVRVASELHKDEQTWVVKTKLALVKKAEELRQAHPQCTVETQIEFGNAGEKILEVATRANATEIVLGSHGRSGFAHYLLGSVAEQVASCTPCTVEIIKSPRLLVRDPENLPHNLNGLLDQSRFVLVLTDTPDGAAAQEWVVSHASESCQKVWVVTACGTKQTKNLALTGANKIHPMVMSHAKEFHHSHLTKLEKSLSASKVSGIVRIGDPSEEILKLAGEIEANLIIIGADERSAYELGDAGTVASTIASQANCSVRVVKATSPMA